ncbi:MAG: hypothetical protein ABR595_03205 [Psychroflexus sp.]
MVIVYKMNESLDQFKATLNRRKERIEKQSRQFKDDEPKSQNSKQADLSRFTDSEIKTTKIKMLKRLMSESKRNRLING